jgi:hypothetical protein
MQNTSRVLLWIILILGGITLIALWGGTFSRSDTVSNEQDNDAEMIVEINEAAEVAQAKLATDLNLDVEEIEVVSIEEKEWPNSCLGLEKEGELCAQVIVPGYLIVLEANDEEHSFRTDATGAILMQE